jgi:hypothetical protein
MGLLNKRKNEDEYIFETTDLLIVFDDDNKTSDIKTITAFAEDSVIVAGYYKVPILDCEITTGKEGRNFFYRAPSRSVQETGRLAQLEMNMVLEQITAYKPPIPPTSMDWTKGLLFAGIFLCVIGLIFK